MLRAIVSGALKIMLAWEDLHPCSVSAQQGAPGPIDDSAHATDENGSRAHGAGLQCDVQAGILQVPPAQALGSRLRGTKYLCASQAWHHIIGDRGCALSPLIGQTLARL